MELLADRDPEEARKILDPVLERMMEAVHRYEGTVNQVMGDGIMALFGAPLAHEDHAVRACYAALRMQEREAYAEDVRALPGRRSPDPRRAELRRGRGRDPSAAISAWTTPRSARRRISRRGWSSSRARDDSLLTRDDTGASSKASSTSRRSDPCREGPGGAGGGLRGDGRGTRRGPACRRPRARGLTRFVGRDAELEQLRRAQQLAGEGRGQVAAVVGEPGVGKSRFIYELTHSHRLQGWRVLGSQLGVLRQGDELAPVIDLLKRYFKIEDRDDAGRSARRSPEAARARPSARADAARAPLAARHPRG